MMLPDASPKDKNTLVMPPAALRSSSVSKLLPTFMKHKLPSKPFVSPKRNCQAP